MRTVSGLFDDHVNVGALLDRLCAEGIEPDDISVVSADGHRSAGGEAAGLGATIGGVGGLLAGLGATALPGIGPVLGSGWLLSALAGAAAGGLAGGVIGSLKGAGFAESDAHVYAEGVSRGSTLVAVRVEEDAEEEVVRRIFAGAGHVDAAARRREYEADGWDGFVQKDMWDDDIGSEDREPK